MKLLRNTIKTSIGAAALTLLTAGACDLPGQPEAVENDPQARSGQDENDALQPSPWAERGRLLAYKRVRRLSRAKIHEVMFDLPFADSYADFGIDDFFDFYSESDIDAVVRYRVDVYQVIYETIDPAGRPAVASGAVLLPRTKKGLKDDVALWGLLRGTVFYDADVPSHGDMPDFGIWRGLLPAAAGYATAMPDYLGFGASRHMVHPYLIPESTATASVDMMRATRHLAAKLGVSLRDEVFLSGHSQGGHATLATLRTLEAEHADEFDLRGAVPASGAYAASGLFDFILNSEALIAPQVTSLYVLAVFGTRDLAEPLSYYFKAPYDEVVLDLHDKTKTNAEVIAGLPSGTTDELFADGFLTAFRGDGALDFKAALALSNVHAGWTPQTPLKLVHGTADDVVPVAMSEAAQAGLGGEGADIEIELIEGAGHLQTIVPATLRSIDWFDSVLEAADD
jgi:predicted esterase